MVNTHTQAKQLTNRKCNKPKRSRDDPDIKHFPFLTGRIGKSVAHMHASDAQRRRNPNIDTLLSAGTGMLQNSHLHTWTHPFTSYKNAVSTYNRWISSNSHNDINVYKTLMLPPQNKTDRLLEIRRARSETSDPDPMEVDDEYITDEDPEFTSDLVFEEEEVEAETRDSQS